jgi:hypothetical protein
MFFYLKRVLARLFDYGFFYLCSILLSLMLPIELDEKFYLLFALAVPFCWIPFEISCLRYAGTTPGKKLFGLSFPKLSWRKSLQQTLLLKGRERPIAQTIPLSRYILALLITCGAASALFKGQTILKVAIHYEEQVTGNHWVQYVSDDGRFSVQFPKRPKVESTTYDAPSGESVNMNEYKAEKEASFSVSYLDLPKKWRLFSSPTLLKGAMNVVLEHTPGAQLIEKKLVKHKNYPALDFRMKEGENEVEGRLILVGNTLYRLMVVYYPDTPREEQHAMFVQSFELKSLTSTT